MIHQCFTVCGTVDTETYIRMEAPCGFANTETDFQLPATSSEVREAYTATVDEAIARPPSVAGL